MCFSATASFVAAIPLSGIGTATLRKTKTKSEIPLAAFPLLFGIQQFIEGIIWLTFMNPMPLVHIIATYAYVGFAYVLWPILTPVAIRLIEPVLWKRKALSILTSIGASAGLYLLYCIVRYPVSSQIVNDSIHYHFVNPFSQLSVFGYLCAVCLSFLFSSHRAIIILGFTAVVSLVLTYFVYTTYVVSVWCFFAALLSIIVYVYFKQRESVKRTGGENI